LPTTLIAITIALAPLALFLPLPSLLPSTLITIAIAHVVAIAIALYVIVAAPLAALTITLFVACHSCCRHHCPCCCHRLPATLVAVTIGTEQLRNLDKIIALLPRQA
jgi:hypothetical protein